MAPMVISVHSVVGLDFAGGLTPGWHSTQFPPYFFFGAVISGTALVIILTILVRWGYGLHDIITEYHLNALAKVMLVGSLMLTYAYFWEAWGAIYRSEVADRLSSSSACSVSRAGSYWTEKVLDGRLFRSCFGFRSVRRSPILLLLISAGIIVGMWLERYVFIVIEPVPQSHPDLVVRILPDLLGLDDCSPGRSGLFLTLFFLCLRLLPIVSMSEVREIVDKASQK